MTAKVSRRRYDVLTRFLRETVANPKIGHRVRMAAAFRLDDLYARVEAAAERAEVRKERALQRDREDRRQDGPLAAEETTLNDDELTADEKMRQVFGDMLNGTD